MQIDSLKKYNIFVGPYGSGKSEVAINFALYLANQNLGKIVIIDLDTITPFFRSREVREELEKIGITVFPKHNIIIDVPTLNYGILTEADYIILDVGGDKGSSILIQYAKDLIDNYYKHLVINTRRMETRSIIEILKQIDNIRLLTGLDIHFLLNNTTLIDDDSVKYALEGEKILSEVSEKSNIPISFTSIEKRLLKGDEKFQYPILPIKRYLLRPGD